MTPLAFLSVAAIHLAAAISPGQAFVLAVRTAAAEGFRPALGLALGFGIGAFLWAATALLGLSLMLDTVPVLFTVLKVAGGLFLLYLAVRIWRHAPDPLPVIDPSAAPRGLGSAVRLGLFGMLANPKPAIFFGAVFVGLVPATALPWEKAVVLLNIFWVEAAWYVVVARVFSLPRARAAYGRLKTAVDRGLGLALGTLGLRFVIS